MGAEFGAAKKRVPQVCSRLCVGVSSLPVVANGSVEVGEAAGTSLSWNHPIGDYREGSISQGIHPFGYEGVMVFSFLSRVKGGQQKIQTLVFQKPRDI